MMTEDCGELLRLEWEKHRDWSKLGKFMSERQVGSFRAGFKSGAMHKAQVIKQVKKLMDDLSEIAA